MFAGPKTPAPSLKEKMMLRLNNLSIGTKLVIMSGLGVTLMAGMIATLMLGNSSVRSAIEDTTVSESITQAASDSRASIRGLEIGLRDMRLALALDGSQKAMDFFHEQKKSVNGLIDFLLQSSKIDENQERMKKVKALADQYVAEVENIAKMNAEIFSLQG
jgi:hypothetical protein